MPSLVVPLDFTGRQRNQFIWSLRERMSNCLLFLIGMNIGDRLETGFLLICVSLGKYKFLQLLTVENKTYFIMCTLKNFWKGIPQKVNSTYLRMVILFVLYHR